MPPKQPRLPLGDDSHTIPDFTPVNPLFTGRAVVLRADYVGSDDGTYKVNLTTGTCTCKWGKPFYWDPRKREWLPAKYCVHKIKAIADIVSKNKTSELLWDYIKVVGTRYNMYETVSAFHKELRRGNLEMAWYFANVLMTFRGASGIMKYLLNIVYEETRDHELADHLLTQVEKNKKPTFTDVCRAIDWFCRAPKKWELPWRLEIFKAEMSGYQRLVDEFGKAVAKPAEIIDEVEVPKLLKALLRGVAEGDKELAQYGLKGLQKAKPVHGDLQNHRLYLYGRLANVCKTRGGNVERFYEWIDRKRRITKEIGYHDLNTLVDMLCGEPYGKALTPRISKGQALRRSALPFPLGKTYGIPLYAHDNHTILGKGLISRHPHELEPTAVQQNLDLRWCGAYFGVAWRMLAYSQHKSCNVAWGKVKWPKGLHGTVMQLWY
jgi:hypothetical protein